MNKLEKEIEQGAENFEKENSKYCSDEVCEAIAHDGFKEGAEFILSKNLMSKFGDWLFDNFSKNELGYYKRKDPYYRMDIDDMSDPFTSEFLEFYWINNIYGK